MPPTSISVLKDDSLRNGHMRRMIVGEDETIGLRTIKEEFNNYRLVNVIGESVIDVEDEIRTQQAGFVADLFYAARIRPRHYRRPALHVHGIDENTAYLPGLPVEFRYSQWMEFMGGQAGEVQEEWRR